MRKLKYLILLTAIIVLCGCINITGGETKRPVAEYIIVNSLEDREIYYETEYELIENPDPEKYEDIYTKPIKQGRIESGKYQELGLTNKLGMDEDSDYYIYMINIYEDAEHKKLLYSYKDGDVEEAKKIFIYGSGEEFNFPNPKNSTNRVIFNMTEDKIIK